MKKPCRSSGRRSSERTREIVGLLNERAAVWIGSEDQTGRADGKSTTPPRESMVYRHLEEFNEGILSEAALRGVFREILSASRFLQTPTTVAFLGPEASSPTRPPWPTSAGDRRRTHGHDPGGLRRGRREERANGGSFPSKTPPRVRSRPRWTA